MGKCPAYAETVKLGRHDVPVKNRLVKAAMVEGLCSLVTGQPNEKHYVLYREWAKMGYGMLISGNVCIASDHLGTPGDLRLPRDLNTSRLKPWQKLATAMRHNNTVSILQLVHTGRQSVRGGGRWPWTAPLAPSAIRVTTNASSWIANIVESIAFQVPRAMSSADIRNVISQFVKGAVLAEAAGFRGIQLHARWAWWSAFCEIELTPSRSHGYLLSAYLSPKTNQRDDAYGGTIEDRLRIVLETTDAIRQKVGKHLIIGIKLNAADYVAGGLTEEEALEHVKLLTLHGGIDFIEISGGSYENIAFLDTKQSHSRPSDKAKAREAFFQNFSSQAKEAVAQACSAKDSRSISRPPLIMCTGGFRTAGGIASALVEDGIDLVGIGRPSVVDPTWPRRLLSTPTIYGKSQEVPAGERQTESVDCVKYEVKGGRWLQTLIPLKLVGASVDTLWHQMQMRRICRNLEPDSTCSFEKLMWIEIKASLASTRLLEYLTCILALSAVTIVFRVS